MLLFRRNDEEKQKAPADGPGLHNMLFSAPRIGYDEANEGGDDA